ncbi:MAG: hypothetical protein CMF18_08400 [Idiomarinaceae bacterium]|nr:hypothetical protein [Idiomarinaceae bacterium]|tara:strand:- start:713 stop:1384 length:672 start_codon:yes stop_codon:yes gene_type:complete
MNWEFVGTLMGSLGGASVVVAVFAQFLGKIWSVQIAQSTKHQFKSEFERLQTENRLALQKFESESKLLMKEKEQFFGISSEFYRDFLSERVETYQKLLAIKNRYIEELEEEITTEVNEEWGRVYHSTYTALRQLIIGRQLYISNELDLLFGKLRSEASHYVKEADLVEAYASVDGRSRPWENEELRKVYNEFAKSTNEGMNKVMEKISQDVSKLRSRIEVDKA